MRIKAELAVICSFGGVTNKRIKDLDAMIQKPLDQMIRHVCNDSIKRDPESVAMLLMAINNKLYLTFVS